MLDVPDWIDSGITGTNGLDLLALRAASMRIGNSLLDGITTVTPSPRYLSFITWITFRYWKSEGENSRTAYLAYARKLEAAIVLGNHIAFPGIQGLIGSDAQVIRTGDGNVSLDISVRALGTAVYRGAAEQLGLLYTDPSFNVPKLTVARGIPLAMKLDELARKSTLGRRLADEALPDSATEAELGEFGALMKVDRFSPSEKEVLIKALLPSNPSTPMERNRVASYGAFLACAVGGQASNEFRRMLEQSVWRTRELPKEFDRILDRWSLFLVRDLLAVAHEYAFSVVLDSLRGDEIQVPSYVDRAEVIRRAVQQTSQLDIVFRDLGIGVGGKSYTTLSYRELAAGVVAVTSREERVHQGLRRWEGGLQESDVIRVIRATPRAAPWLLPIAWLLIERRVGEGVRTGRNTFHILSQDGYSRLGLEQRVFPLLEDFRARDISLLDAVAELADLTVEQHLHTAWARLANNRNEVSTLLADGEKWIFRKAFRPGQMDSRLAQVWNWTSQLGWTTPEGLTLDGQRVLDQILATLDQEASW